jgi:hypothetical protein
LRCDTLISSAFALDEILAVTRLDLTKELRHWLAGTNLRHQGGGGRL